MGDILRAAERGSVWRLTVEDLSAQLSVSLEWSSLLSSGWTSQSTISRRGTTSSTSSQRHLWRIILHLQPCRSGLVVFSGCKIASKKYRFFLKTLKNSKVSILWSRNVFTVRCYAERGYATACRPSVRPSVRLSVTFRYRDHIGWNSSKIISRPNSLRPMRGLTPTWAIWCNGNTHKIGVE